MRGSSGEVLIHDHGGHILLICPLIQSLLMEAAVKKVIQEMADKVISMAFLEDFLKTFFKKQSYSCS